MQSKEKKVLGESVVEKKPEENKKEEPNVESNANPLNQPNANPLNQANLQEPGQNDMGDIDKEVVNQLMNQNELTEDKKAMLTNLTDMG